MAIESRKNRILCFVVLSVVVMMSATAQAADTLDSYNVVWDSASECQSDEVGLGKPDFKIANH